MASEPAKRRARLVRYWHFVNPLARPFAGLAPWWVLVETTGRRSGRPRRTPIARGPIEDDALWLIAVHGRESFWVKNLGTTPSVRVKVSGHWREGTASVHPYDEEFARRFNRYARSGPRMMGIEPALVRIDMLA